MQNKKCSQCDKVLNLSEFSPNKNLKCGYNAKCRKCVNENLRKYRKRNNTSLNYYYRNRVKCNEQSKLYSRNNREKRNEIQRIWRRNKRKTDPSYKCWENARKRIWKIIHKNKKNNTLDLIGTTPLLFKLWLEYTFTTNMNWDNYGTYWEIDHVIPISTFDMKDTHNIFRAFNWKNCRAETKQYNNAKRNVISKEQMIKHYQELIYFEKIYRFKVLLKTEIRNQAFYERE